jgi:hypothetical protein
VALPPEIDCPQHAAISRDGAKLAVSNGSGLLCVVDLISQNGPVLIRDKGSTHVEISGQGDELVTYDVGTAGIARWNPATGERLGETLIDERVIAAAFSPDNQLLVVDNGRELIALDKQTWRERRRITVANGGGAPSWASQISFASSGMLMAVSRAGYRIVLATPDCRRVLATLPAEIPHTPTCLSPNGQLLACLGPDALVQFWDVARVRKNLEDLALDW